MSTVHRARGTYPPAAGRPFTAEEDALLGTLTDREIAERLGRDMQTVQARRKALGIPSHRPHRPTTPARTWTPADDALLGTMPDGEVARQLGCTAAMVVNRRRKLGWRRSIRGGGPRRERRIESLFPAVPFSRYGATNRNPLTHEQARQIGRSLFPSLNYLFRLRSRMMKVGFPHDDKLFQVVCQAYDALHRLNVEVHFLACDGVYGTPEEGPQPD